MRAAALRVIVAGLVLVLTAQLAVPRLAAAMTIAEYQALTDRDSEDANPNQALFYLLGVMEGIVSVSAYLRNQEIQVFCNTGEGGININVNDFMESLDLHLMRMAEERPNFEEMAQETPIGLAAVDFLATLFPCGTGETE